MMGIGMEITLIVSLTLVCITLWSAGGVFGDPPDAQTRRHRPGCSFSAVYRTLSTVPGLIIYFKIAQYFLGAELIILPGGKDLPGCFIPARISAIALSNLSNSGASR
ncbi:magnesium transporter [Klebsiella michiganensis]|uniref:Magnesium transporter n=1 Tax=Klebsiella michiganensis TaxID=1134687 RepID=A0A7H4PG32_9ENTR|nr:magnesium transporter [Klebsiella michiganensis]